MAHFERVETAVQQRDFDEKWRGICEERGATFISNHENTTSYFILNDKGERVGTVAFNKRDPEIFSLCESHFPFEEQKLVSKNHQEVFEIGKISIFKEHRRGGHVNNMIALMYLHGKKHAVKQYIGYIDKDFYNVLLMGYGVRLKKLANEYKTEKHTVVPIVCVDVQKTLKKLEESGRVKLPIMQ